MMKSHFLLVNVSSTQNVNDRPFGCPLQWLFLCFAVLLLAGVFGPQAAHAQWLKIPKPEITKPPKFVTPRLPVSEVTKVQKDILSMRDKMGDDFQRAGKDAREKFQQAGKDGRESLQRESKRLRQDTQRESVRLRESLGWEWNDKIRDPAVTTAEHKAKQFYEGKQRAQRSYDEGLTRIPQIVSGADAKYHNVPRGSGRPGAFGEFELSTYDSPGMVGTLINERYYRWGFRLRFEGRLRVHQGMARLVVITGDGRMIGQSPWEVAGGIRQPNLRIALPEEHEFPPLHDAMGRSSHYALAIELAPNSSATLMGVSYQRD